MNDISTSQGRMADLQGLYDCLVQVMKEREVAYGDDEFGKTGLYSRKFTIQGSREYPVIVEEYSMDHRLVRTLNKLTKQMAVERRWQEKARQTGKGPFLLPYAEYLRILNEGRDRVGYATIEREAREAAEKAQAEGAARDAAEKPGVAL